MNNEEKEKTGLRLFLEYGAPCLKWRLMANKISPGVYAELKRILRTKFSPRLPLLKSGLRSAVDSYLEYGRTNSSAGEVWSLPSVADYWHNHHFHPGERIERDVWKARVVKIKNLIVTIRIGNHEMIFQNIFRLQLQVGDEVYTHGEAIVEKIM